MPIRAISFDLFDTLVDLLTETLPREEYQGRTLPRTLIQLHALMSKDAPVAFDDYLQAIQEVDGNLRKSHYARDREVPSLQRFEEVLRRLGIGDKALAESMVGLHMGGLYAQVRILDHHREVLSELKKNFRLAVCSNFSHSETAHRVLEDAGLMDLMDAVLISDAVGIRKPAPEIFHATLAALEVEPGELLHVGDRLGADVAGPAALGIRTAWIVRRVKDPEAARLERPEPAPDLRIQDLAELPALLQKASPFS
jgi:putative hydrolase of the HAD superfamily